MHLLASSNSLCRQAADILCPAQAACADRQQSCCCKQLQLSPGLG